MGLTKPNPADPSKAQFSAADLTELYKKHGQTIFPSKFGMFRQLRSWVYGPKYSPSGLEAVLREYFGKAILNCALIPVTVTAYELEDGRPFFSSRGDSETTAYLMRDIIRAATAAPTYFPPAVLPASPTHEPKGYYALMDGGVFANDPETYAELLSLPELTHPETPNRPPPSLLLVSIGTGTQQRSAKFQQAWNWGRITWLGELFDEILFTNSNQDITVLRPDRLFQSFRGGLAGFAYVQIRFQPILSEAPLDDASDEEIGKLEAKTRANIKENRHELASVCDRLCRNCCASRSSVEGYAVRATRLATMES